MIIGLKKGVFAIDGSDGLVTVAYGFSDRKEAVKTLCDYSGVDKEDLNLRRVKITRHKKDGEWYYWWGKNCKECGHKNEGVISYIDECY